MKILYKSVICAGIFLILFSCAKRSGDMAGFSPPSTRLFLSKINLDSANSLSGKVRLYWSGESPNGFVRYFEFYADTNSCSTSLSDLKTFSWNVTNRTDSAFLFRIPAGRKTSLISFYVRSVDNNDLRDPNPPCLEVPIKNTPPVATFDKLYNSKPITDSVHLTFTMGFSATDADGDENIDSVYIKLNSSRWIAFSKNVNLLTFIPMNPKSTDSTGCHLLISALGRISGITIPGLRMESRNKIYLRSKDISLSYSLPDSAVFYCKSQKSDLLLIDAFKGNTEKNIYLNAIRPTYAPGVDYYEFYRQGGSEYVPLYWNLSFSEMLKFYKKIFWFDDNNTDNGQYTLESASTALQNFQNTGGKLLISIKQLPYDQGSSLFGIMPYDSLSKNIGQGQVFINTKIVPQKAGYDTLQSNANIAPVTTLYPKSQVKLLYTANINPVNGWTGTNNIAAYTEGNNGKPNLIFFSVPIYQLNKNSDSFKNLFDNIFNTEFKDQ